MWRRPAPTSKSYPPDATKHAELALLAGMFWGGGARFELGDGATVHTGLRVRTADFERALGEIKGDKPTL